MKKLLFITCLIAFISAGLFAQAASQSTPALEKSYKSAEEHAKMETDNLNKAVPLSTEQYAKVLDINKKFFAQPRATGGKTPAQMANEREKDIKAVLTNDQLQTLNNSKAK